jgi:predicted SAM-dependent methyltransferase
MTDDDSLVKINLGCGRRWKAGWKNLDGGPWTRVSRLRRLKIFNWLLPKACLQYPPDLIVADLRRTPLPFPDDSASVIFSGYALEYLTAVETEEVLRECRRILAPGGLIRLCQTDIGTIIARYVSRKPDRACVGAVENAAEFLRHAAPEHTKWTVRLFRRGGVQQLFDQTSLEYLLQTAGFVDPRYYRTHEGECPDLRSIERPERQTAPFIHLEARKPVHDEFIRNSTT